MTMANVLFVCVDNSFLSLTAEAYLNSVSDGSVRAFSAGPLPREAMRSATRKTLFANGLAEQGLHPKPWSIFALPHAPQPDYVIRLQDSLLLNQQPLWPGRPEIVDWNISQTLEAPKNVKEAAQAFDKIKDAINLSLASKRFTNDSRQWRKAG